MGETTDVKQQCDECGRPANTYVGGQWLCQWCLSRLRGKEDTDA